MLVFTFFTKLLHYFPSEISHHIALKGLKFLYILGLFKLFKIKQNTCSYPDDRNILKISNKLGIAAGLDKNGDYIDCLAALGVGFIEVGTVTPRPQKGNSKPRIFRNKTEKSLLNRLGFNNKGVEYLVERLKQRKTKIIIGSSIGKNFDTPNNKASQDYIFCLEKVYEYSDYIAVNISSPNTKDLRELSNIEYLDTLLNNIKKKQEDLSAVHGYKPIFIKISPDESSEDLKAICNSISANKLDGVICSNTTSEHKDNNGSGGLSGTPLKLKAAASLEKIRGFLGSNIPIIASGGIMSVEDYIERMDMGADFVQIYTGFIYEGPKLIEDINNHHSE